MTEEKGRREGGKGSPTSIQEDNYVEKVNYTISNFILLVIRHFSSSAKYMISVENGDKISIIAD